MGADFTISVIEIKKGDELAYKERVISGILEITEGWLKENAEGYDLYSIDTDIEIKPQLIAIINKTWDAFESRNVAWHEFNDMTFYIAGGLSWGDDPSDEYSLFSDFNRIVDLIEEGNY